VNGYDRYMIGVRACDAERGYCFVDVGIPGERIFIHPDKDCTHSGCPRAGTVHRHQPSLAEREAMDDYITRWLIIEYEREGQRKDVVELGRMFRL
jgi:hypothetical protein